MFPSNFVNIVKPLENSEPAVKTLYAFSAETSEDLSFPVIQLFVIYLFSNLHDLEFLIVCSLHQVLI